MEGSFSTGRCTNCGTLNRHPHDIGKSGVFNCGKCGKPLLSAGSGNRKTTGAPETRRSFGPLLAVLFVAGAIYATIANYQRHDRSSSLTASDAKQQQESKSAAPPAPKPISSAAAPQVPTAPPVQSLKIPKLSRARTDELAVVREFGTQAKSLGPDLAFVREFGTQATSLEMVTPAPGCQMLPSRTSVYNICQRLDQQACDSNPLCSWGTGPSCSPRDGASASSNPLGSPGDVDYIEPMDVTVVGKPSRFQIGDDLFAKKRFNRAIAEYTKALESKPNWPMVLMSRAMAYEAAGDKPHAIADYCKILVIYSTRKRRAIAMDRIAQLTQPQQQATHTPPPVPAAGEKTAKPELPSPRTGDIVQRRGRKAIAPFGVMTELGQNYFIKLVNVENAKDQIWIYVKGGESYSTKVAVGTYNFRAATGNEWYGREDLFGPNTHFFRLRPKKGAAADAPQTLQFRKEGNRIIGMTISLKSVADGNIEQEAMSRSEFDAN